jgi:hypothetical protein
VSDPAGIAAAAVRAHMLLAEGHQPLTMTPGDLRALLSRYRHRLQELADAVEPVTAVDNPKPGSTPALRTRLKDLPHGHPSSPYNEDGSRKPPVLRLQDIDLSEPEDGPQLPTARNYSMPPGTQDACRRSAGAIPGEAP